MQSFAHPNEETHQEKQGEQAADEREHARRAPWRAGDLDTLLLQLRRQLVVVERDGKLRGERGLLAEVPLDRPFIVERDLLHLSFVYFGQKLRVAEGGGLGGQQMREEEQVQHHQESRGNQPAAPT
ncbi:hypothetical protein AORI_4605 [Amycolatopsis keratiniphila]|uniref:Uncharacterized protein n=1 Tax=Amycolatopsis keratiniphila TaxID=129921 RepID=R4SUY2_9PSEU|nr:hypothetical protein AORI_4605 [Amycolatopsis keratiniphila]